MVRQAVKLVVSSGPDLGTQLVLGEKALLVGRGRDCDLQLSDRAVSRRHLLVEHDGEKIRIRVQAGASPLRLDGRQYAEVSLALGRRFIIGETALMAVAQEENNQTQLAREVTLVRSLMSDRSVDAHGLGAIFSLSEALDRASDHPSVLAAVAGWARTFVSASEIRWQLHEDAPAAAEIIEETRSDGHHRLVYVPLLGISDRSLVLQLPGQGGPLKTMLRRLLATAGRLVASALLRLAAVEEVEEESVAFRRLAWGSARRFLGGSEEAKAVQQLVDKLAQREVALLIGGETGVGKSFLARLIHEAGPRAQQPFRVVNCAAIPENLVESELFGHERGAFTGADARRVGVLEAVGEGSVLLDEIGDLPLASQAKLLHVLESRSFEAVGSNRSIELKARVLAATNRDLKAMAEAGTFRSDLYFRLSVVGIELPPLRRRGADIVLLAEQFLDDLRQATGRRVQGFSDKTKELLLAYPWPGNVRELRNAVEHALVLGDEEWIQPGDLPMSLSLHEQPRPDPEDDRVELPLKMAELERLAIAAALRKTGGNRSKAAAILGINRVTLYKKLKAFEEEAASDDA